VDPAVGLVVRVEVGDACQPGDALATVHARTEEDAETAANTFRSLLQLVDHDVERPARILDRINEA
jgi:thymidine phosphorylase